jgi:hypothetical protein
MLTKNTGRQLQPDRPALVRLTGRYRPKSRASGGISILLPAS